MQDYLRQKAYEYYKYISDNAPNLPIFRLNHWRVIEDLQALLEKYDEPIVREGLKEACPKARTWSFLLVCVDKTAERKQRESQAETAAKESVNKTEDIIAKGTEII